VAYGTTTQYGADVALQTAFEASFVDAVYRNNEFLGMSVNGVPVFPASPLGGDISSFRWKVNSAGNTSAEVFTEGGTQPTPVAQTYVNAAVAAVYFRAMTRISGHVRDAINQGAAFTGLDVIEQEFALGFADIQDLVNTTLMGSTNSGLEVAIDSGSTYAGIARGSAAYWESTETALGGALTRAGLLNLHEAIRDNDKGGRPGLLIGPHNQWTNYAQLAGEPGAANNSVRVMGSGNYDIAPSTASFMGLPFASVGDFTDTVIAMLDINAGQWALKIRRPFEVRADQSGDDDVYQLSTASCLICRSPKRHGKLTGVTA